MMVQQQRSCIKMYRRQTASPSVSTRGGHYYYRMGNMFPIPLGGRVLMMPQLLTVQHLLLFFCMCFEGTMASMSMSRPLPQMDAWFFIAKYIRPEWFQWTLTVLIFLIFVILSQMSCLRPADVNKFDKTMQPNAPTKVGGKGGPPGKKAPPGGKGGPSKGKGNKSQP